MHSKNHSKLKVSLVDLNEEAKYVVQSLLDYHLHVVPARLAARLFDPDAYIIGSAPALPSRSPNRTARSARCG